MTTFFRQLNIDIRRNVGLLFLPLIVIVAWILLDAQSWTTFLWWETNRVLPQAFLPFACPAIAAAAAWMGGRDRRSGVEDLLATTALPAARRRTVVLLATATWGIVAFALFALYVLGQTATQATWGGPEIMPLMVGISAILAHAGWGYLAGTILPSRFTAPLTGVAALGIQQLAAQHRIVYDTGASGSTWVNGLAAHNGTSSQHVVLYLGIFALALALLHVRQLSRLASAGAVVLAAGVALAGVVLIWGMYPDVGLAEDDSATGEIAYRNNFGQRIVYEDMFSAEPVCAGDPVTVCTHPAYQPVLDQAIEDAADLVKPLLGLPGVPLRIEADEVSLYGGSLDDAYLSFLRFADRLVADEDTLHFTFRHLVNDAQIAIHEWLLTRSGWVDQTMCRHVDLHHRAVNGWPSRERCAVVERFDRLPESEQRAWLEAHYQELRRGRLTLDDLP